MATELWYRNPHDYIRELVEAREHLVAWDRGILVKRKIDPIKHAELYFGEGVDWRVLAIGLNGTAEYRPGDSTYKPTAVYPTWGYGEDQALLEELVECPVGSDETICSNTSVSGDERPVFGQEHIVVITDLPDARSGPGRAFFAYLKTLSEDNPGCKIYIHGSYSFRIAFGMGFHCADFEPRTVAQRGDIFLPTGKRVKFERGANYGSWLTAFGFTAADLAIPAKRCIFNIKSTRWAADYYEDMYAPSVRKSSSSSVDTVTPSASFAPKGGKALSARAGASAKEGDKFNCDTCSLSTQCSYFREGAVCGIPGAEPKSLASFFNTRDSSTILDGLAIIVSANARRLDKGIAAENSLGDISPEVTKLMGQVFGQGEKLAKLIDPSLRGGANVQVNVGAGSQASVVAAADPRQLVASVIQQLENKGIDRENITPEMISTAVKQMTDPSAARRELEAARYINEAGEAVE